MAGQKYLVDEAGALLVDGSHNCGGGPHDLFAELACSRKEAGAPRAQPWKAHWSPANDSSETTGHKYLVDDTGALLVDGVHNCASADPFAELAFSRKVEEV